MFSFVYFTMYFYRCLCHLIFTKLKESDKIGTTSGTMSKYQYYVFPGLYFLKKKLRRLGFDD